MKISIITPSYNQGQFLGETIDSVLGQDYPYKELIVIDGGSTDGSAAVLERHRLGLAYWVSEKDRGQSHAINKGLAKATGDVVTWLNSDDRAAPGAFRTVADLFARHPDAGVVHGSTVLFDRRGVLRNDAGYAAPGVERYLSGMAFPQPSAYMRRPLLEAVGGVDERFHYGMDYDLFARLALCTRFQKTEAVLSHYRLHDASKSVTQDERFVGDWIRTFLDVAWNLGLEDLLATLRGLGVFEAELAVPRRRFAFAFRAPPLDSRLLLFYFLSYVVKADGRAGHYRRARKVLRHVGSAMPEWTRQDCDLRRLARRFWLLPDCCLRAARSVKARLLRVRARTP